MEGEAPPAHGLGGSARVCTCLGSKTFPNSSLAPDGAPTRKAWSKTFVVTVVQEKPVVVVVVTVVTVVTVVVVVVVATGPATSWFQLCKLIIKTGGERNFPSIRKALPKESQNQFRPLPKLKTHSVVIQPNEWQGYATICIIPGRAPIHGGNTAQGHHLNKRVYRNCKSTLRDKSEHSQEKRRKARNNTNWKTNNHSSSSAPSFK